MDKPKFINIKAAGFVERINKNLPKEKRYQIAPPYKAMPGVATELLDKFFDYIESQPEDEKQRLRQYGKYVITLLAIKNDSELFDLEKDTELFPDLPAVTVQTAENPQQQIQTIQIVEEVAYTISTDLLRP